MKADVTGCCSYGGSLKGVGIKELIKSSDIWDSETLPTYRERE
ncbi:hypothetical protein [Microbulbifer celer]|uniref:Uncharacterized protein n=1 Tax=Microbulbifer celer TaxID=435905 RepID=A0ABW3UF80_9GAMM|nr:hypothetical protein [Microbulbifer celer]